MRKILLLISFLTTFNLVFSKNPCEIYNMTIEIGDCNADGTYHVWLNFQVENPTSDQFDLWANGGQFLGTFSVDSLPLHLTNFQTDGGDYDKLKACMHDNDDCCRTKEFLVPDCAQPPAPCSIYDVAVETGDCNNDGGYEITVNFEVTNPGNDFFEIWNQNGQYLGYFNLDSLPLHLTNFPTDGGDYDKIKICINDHPDCCKYKEFLVPDCVTPPAPCEIYDLVVETGDCTSNNTYNIWINFQVENPGTSQFFKLWANNGQFLGTFSLDSLPLHLTNFPTDGGTNDFLKVCIVDQSNCCRTKEFPVPACILPPAPCEIYNLTVETGDCNNDGGYAITVNFQVQNPGNTLFEVWAGTGQYLGIFPLASLPLHLTNFPTDGGDYDKIKICINDHPDCCRTKEFAVPDCLNPPPACEIYNLNVETGDCNGDTSYHLTVNFQVQNPGSNHFKVWANAGQFLGIFPLASLPLHLPNFQSDGGDYDKIKVCIDGQTNCCRIKEFEVPECFAPGQYDLKIAPNPAGGLLNVTTRLPSGKLFGAADVNIYNVAGQMVLQKTEADGSTFSLDVKFLPAGVYQIRVVGKLGSTQAFFGKI